MFRLVKGVRARRWSGALLLAAVAAGGIVPVAQAQIPVVQPLPGSNSRQLNAALARLASDPRDVQALLDAGNAALVLGDTDAALGFLNRADQVSPNNHRVKAALAGALLRNDDPYDALTYFDQAERAGAPISAIAPDRGLAYDLVGANVDAQKYYRQALGTLRTDELVRRYALSLAINGDRAGADAMLAPLLTRQDPAAWRTRAFILAIGGDLAGAEQVVKATMPPNLASGIVPYLQYVPRLTRAQQAAAANFGQFPRAAQIGRDDPRAAKYAQATPPPPPVAAAQPADGRRKGNKKTRSGQLAAEQTPVRTSIIAPTRVAAPTQSAPVQPQAAYPTAAPRMASSGELPAIDRAPAVTPPPASFAPPPRAMPQTAVQTPMQGPIQGPPVPADLAVRTPAVATQPPPPATPVATSAAVIQPIPAAPPRPEGLADAFRDFTPPPSEARATVAAVDLSKLSPRVAAGAPVAMAPAREEGPVVGRTIQTPALTKAEAAAKAKKDAAAAKAKKEKQAAAAKAAEEARIKKANPSRIWVQIAVGRNLDYLGAEYAKLLKREPALFKGHKGWSAPVDRNSRMLVGPFPSNDAARTFIGRLHKEGMEALPWTSEAGEVVSPL